MCRIHDNVRGEIYPEVEIGDNLGVGLGLNPATPIPMTTSVIRVVVVGVNGAGAGFFVGSAYVEVVCRRSSRVGEEEAVEGLAWIAQHRDKNGKSNVALWGTYHLHLDDDHGIR